MAEALSDSLAAWEKSEARSLSPTQDDLRQFQKSTTALLELLDGERTAFERAHGALEVAFMRRVLENFRGFGTQLYEQGSPPENRDGPEFLAFMNRIHSRREPQNAVNLRWLVDRYYGRKVIVWAHNGHVMNAYYAADWGALYPEPEPGG